MTKESLEQILRRNRFNKYLTTNKQKGINKMTDNNQNTYQHDYHHADFTKILIKDKKRVSVYLVNGIKLQGTIVFEDPVDSSFILTSQAGNEQKVYRHAISTIVPEGVNRSA